MNPTKQAMAQLPGKAALRIRTVHGRQAQVYTDPETGIEYILQSYAYTASILALASAGASNDVIQVQTDSAFRIEALAAAVFVNNALVAAPYSTVNIKDSGSDATLFDAETPIGNVFGTAQLPLILPTPYMVKPGANLQVNVTNVNSAAAASYYFAFIGSKIYKMG